MASLAIFAVSVAIWKKAESYKRYLTQIAKLYEKNFNSLRVEIFLDSNLFTFKCNNASTDGE